MAVNRFTKLPSGDQVLDRIQDNLAQTIKSHAAQVDSHTTSIATANTNISTLQALVSNKLSFTSNLNAEWVTFTVTTPATDWISPTLVNSWANAGGGNATAQYRKDADGFVTIRGLITGGTINTTAWTLPTGYRPAGNETFVASASNAFGNLAVVNDGRVLPQTGSGTLFSLVARFQCSDASPGILSCFPVNIPATKVTNPKAVFLVSAVDTSVPAITPLPLGSPYWSVTSSTANGVTTYQPVLNNLPGLVVGSRTYSITLLLVGA